MRKKKQQLYAKQPLNIETLKLQKHRQHNAVFRTQKNIQIQIISHAFRCIYTTLQNLKKSIRFFESILFVFHTIAPSTSIQNSLNLNVCRENIDVSKTFDGIDSREL